MKRIGREIAVVLLATGGLALTASPAGADTNLGTVSGLTYIQSDSAGPSTPPAVMSATATCPGGTHVVGGGAAPAAVSSFGPSEFSLNGSRPFDGPDSDTRPDDGWIGRGFNRSGITKSFGSIAICYAGAVRYVRASASAQAGHAMVAKASCPASTHVAGGGAAVGGTARQSYLNATHPFDSSDADRRPDDGWRGRAFNQTGPRKRLDVYAACVSLNPRYAVDTFGNLSGNDVLGSTPCPGSTHGMGGGALPEGTPGQVFLSTVYPYAETTNPPDSGFLVSIHSTAGFASVAIYSICKT